MDILLAYKMVQDTINELCQIQRNFGLIFEAASHFSELASRELAKKSLDINVETAFKQKRIGPRKKLPGETA